MACTLNVASLSRLGVSRKYFPQNLYMVRKELYTVKKEKKSVQKKIQLRYIVGNRRRQ